MAKSSTHLDAIPRAALSALHDLGLNLATARLRRKASLRTWAARLGVSVSTLQRMEAGDPGVGIGVYATALWLVNMSDQLSNLAKPEADFGAITEEVEVIRKRLTQLRGKPRPSVRGRIARAGEEGLVPAEARRTSS